LSAFGPTGSVKALRQGFEKGGRKKRLTLFGGNGSEALHEY
jgi:hypothetical protein